MKTEKKQLGMLAMGVFATLLASSCCVGPLLLVSVGIGGAWVGSLQLLEPYKPFFLGAALLAMVMAYRRIYRQQIACVPGEICALPQTRLLYKILFWLVSLLILLTLGFPYVVHYFY